MVPWIVDIDFGFQSKEEPEILNSLETDNEKETWKEFAQQLKKKEVSGKVCNGMMLISQHYLHVLSPPDILYLRGEGDIISEHR